MSTNYSVRPLGSKASVLIQQPTKQQRVFAIGSGMLVALVAASSSNAGQASSINSARMQYQSSASVIHAREEDFKRNVSADLATIKSLAGLTWLQLAKLLGVSRRTIHGWIDGSEPSARNYAEVKSLLSKASGLAGLPIFKIRKALLDVGGIALAPVPDSPIGSNMAEDNSPLQHKYVVKRRAARSAKG